MVQLITQASLLLKTCLIGKLNGHVFQQLYLCGVIEGKIEAPILENPPFHTYPLLPSYTHCLFAYEHLHMDGLIEREVGISTAGGPISEDVCAVFPKKAGFDPKKLKVSCQESRFPKYQGPTENKDRYRPQARLNTCCTKHK